MSLTGGDAPICIEIIATQKVTLEKSLLANFEPDAAAKLKPGEHSILQRWLSARYRRSGFPDEFDARLVKAGVPEKLKKLLRPLGSVVVAMYFDLDRGEEIKRAGAQDPYELSVFLLYTEQDDHDSFEKAKEAAQKIEDMFRMLFFDPTSQTWKNVELTSCTPISEQSMTYAQSVELKRWNGDFISLGANPQQAVPLE